MRARPATRAFVLQVGWACSYKLLPDGGRQIISLTSSGHSQSSYAGCADGRTEAVCWVIECTLMELSSNPDVPHQYPFSQNAMKTRLAECDENPR
jgi:hypothetical protein